jgi:peptide/nickel transport system ATP-binding protein
MTALVRAERLSCTFRGRGRGVQIMAVRHVDLTIARGEAVGVVGESGCGKSTLGRMLLRLLPPTSGQVVFDGLNLDRLARSDLRRLRRRMQMIFQDPYGSLDPRRSVGRQIADGILIHGLAHGPAVGERVRQLLELVGLDPSYAERLPHQFSGGQRQRVAIARALASRPDFVVADEPVSALDVSVQAQVLNLLSDLRAEFGLTLLFISHDLHIVRHLCERVVVMYLGRIVEEGRAADVFRAPAHPYTRALIAATPSIRAHDRKKIRLSGDLPSAISPPSGCAFRTRCVYATSACADTVPLLRPFGDGRTVACIRAEEIATVTKE